MSIVEVYVDTSQFDTMSQSFQDAMDNVGQGLLDAVEATIMSDLSVLSQTMWNVRTGTYAYGWMAYQMGSDTVMVTNDAPYAASLEYGWTTPTGSTVEGGYVITQAIDTNIGALGEMLTEWLKNQIGA